MVRHREHDQRAGDGQVSAPLIREVTNDTYVVIGFDSDEGCYIMVGTEQDAIDVYREYGEGFPFPRMFKVHPVSGSLIPAKAKTTVVIEAETYNGPG